MNSIRAFFRRLFCPHLYWHRTGMDFGWRVGLREWQCSRCLKTIQRDEANPPVSYFECPRKDC